MRPLHPNIEQSQNIVFPHSLRDRPQSRIPVPAEAATLQIALSTLYPVREKRPPSFRGR